MVEIAGGGVTVKEPVAEIPVPICDIRPEHDEMYVGMPADAMTKEEFIARARTVFDASVAKHGFTRGPIQLWSGSAPDGTEHRGATAPIIRP